MNTLNQLSVLAVCYVFLFLLCFAVWKMKSASLTSLKVINGNWLLLHIRHAGGMIIMTLVPLIFLSVIPEGLLVWPKDIDNIQVLTLLITGFVLLIITTKETDNLESKKVSSGSWSSFHAVLHIVLRNSFLVSYEWFFRGIILFSCVSIFGVIPAIIINVALYALIHSFNGRKEFLGSIPFGIILCAFTIWWHSVWPAVLLHMLLSSTYESVLLRKFFSNPSKINI